MSLYIDQIYQRNPAISMQPTDIFWFVRYPYSKGSDFGVPFSVLTAGLPHTQLYAGNPNSHVAGNQGDFVVDTTTGNTLYTCTISGTASTAVWAIVAGAGGAPTGNAGGDLGSTYPNPTVVALNGTPLSDLSTGILKNTTGTGIPSIAIAEDFPTLNQNTTGNAATATISSACSGNASTVTTNANLIGDCTSSGNTTTVVKINGISLAGLATGILKNTTSTGVPSIAVAADFPTLNQNTTGSSGSCTGNSATVTTNANLTGDCTSSGNATTVVKINGTSLAGLATGILKNTSGTGVPSIAIASDFPTLNQNTTGNAGTVTTNANLTGDCTSSGNATTVIKIQGKAVTAINAEVVQNLINTGSGGVNYLDDKGNYTVPPGGGGSSYPAPSATLVYYNDLVGSSLALSGIQNYTTGTSSTAAYDNTTSGATHWGVWRLTTGPIYGGSNNAASTITTDGSSYTGKLGGGIVTFECNIRMPTALSNSAGDGYQINFGFADSTGPWCAAYQGGFNICAIQYTDNVNSGNWVGTTQSAGGTIYTTNHNTGPAAATWYRLQIVVNAAANSVTFYVNGVAFNGGALTTGIPTSNLLSPLINITKTAGTSNVSSMFIDYYWYTVAWTTPR